jgi:hypothetical protein
MHPFELFDLLFERRNVFDALSQLLRRIAGFAGQLFELGLPLRGIGREGAQTAPGVCEHW